MLAKLLKFVTEAKKAAVGLVGVAAILAETHALNGTAGQVVAGILAVGTVLGIYQSTNADAAPAAYGEGEGVLD